MAGNFRTVLDLRAPTETQLAERRSLRLCAQTTETIDHLLLGCPYSREVWFKLLRPSGHHRLMPPPNASIVDWWLRSRKGLSKELRRRFDTFFALVCWEIWKERNRRVFQRQGKLQAQRIQYIKDEAALWYRAGYRSLSGLLSLSLVGM